MFKRRPSVGGFKGRAGARAGRGGGKRTAKYVLPKDAKIDYKNVSLLQKYLTDRGKILSRRITGVSGKNQRDLSLAIKRARTLALLPVGSSKRR